MIRKKPNKPNNFKRAAIRKKYDCFAVVDGEGNEVGWWRTKESAEEHAQILNNFYKEMKDC